jgi:putative PIN family toxin of toxin-antitoxin system
MSGGFTLVTSPALVDELDEKLRGKFQVPDGKLRTFLAELMRKGLVVRPQLVLDAVPGDPDDNRVLECAVAGHADCIVSGDKHLLRLVSYEAIAILTVRQFLETAGFLAPVE